MEPLSQEHCRIRMRFTRAHICPFGGPCCLFSDGVETVTPQVVKRIKYNHLSNRWRVPECSRPVSVTEREQS